MSGGYGWALTVIPGVLDTAKAQKRPDLGKLSRTLCKTQQAFFFFTLFSMTLLTMLPPLTTTINKDDNSKLLH